MRWIIPIPVCFAAAWFVLWWTDGSWLGAAIGLPLLAVVAVLSARAAWVGMGEEMSS